MNKELVYHPTHYSKEGRKECWEEMLEIFGADAVVIFDCLSAYKYDYRAGEKEDNPEEQDKEKIKNYLNHVNELIKDYKLNDDALEVIRRTEVRIVNDNQPLSATDLIEDVKESMCREFCKYTDKAMSKLEQDEVYVRCEYCPLNRL